MFSFKPCVIMQGFYITFRCILVHHLNYCKWPTGHNIVHFALCILLLLKLEYMLRDRLDIDANVSFQRESDVLPKVG